MIIQSRLIISQLETKFSLYHNFDHLMLWCIPICAMEFSSKVENVSFVSCLSNTSIPTSIHSPPTSTIPSPIISSSNKIKTIKWMGKEKIRKSILLAHGFCASGRSLTLVDIHLFDCKLLLGRTLLFLPMLEYWVWLLTGTQWHGRGENGQAGKEGSKVIEYNTPKLALKSRF